MAFLDRVRAFLQPYVPPLAGEVGIADTRRWTTTQYVSRLPPYNPDDLTRSKGVKIYDQMRKDPQVKACLWLTKAAITGPGWKLEPVGDTEQEKTLAETLTTDLQTLSPFGFDDALSELLTAMAYGFAVNEKVYGIVDGRIRLTGLKGKAPHDIEFDADPFGNLRAIQQRQSQIVDLDPEKFVWFAMEPEFGNFYGNSMLRPAYWPWHAKTCVRQFWAIYAEKFAIPAVVGIAPATERDEGKLSKVRDILSKLQASTAFTVTGEWKIQLLEASKDPQVFQAILDWCNLEISRSILLPDKSGYAGAEIKGGSYSLAKTQFDLYTFVLTEHRTRLQRAIQQQLIDEMAEIEAPGIDPPRFAFLPLTDDDVEAIGKIWIDAVTNGAVMAELEDENHFRRSIKFPERTVKAGMPDVPPATDTHLNPPEMQQPANAQGKPAPAKVEASEGKGFWRALTLSERRADMAEKRAMLDASTDALGKDLAAAVGDLIADLRKKAKRMPKASASVRNLTPSATSLRAVRVAVDAALRGAYDQATKHAVGEVRRIKKTMTEAETERLEMASRGGLVGSRAQAFFRDKAIYVTGLIEGNILKRAQQVLFNALKNDKTPGQVMFELDDALGEWLPQTDARGRVVNVPARIENIARTNIAEAVNEGRWATFTDPDLESFINAVRYSAVLDDRTRENHAAWDGVTLPMDHPAWFGPPDNRPPNGFQCRCVLVPIGGADADEMTADEDIPSDPAADEGFK